MAARITTLRAETLLAWYDAHARALPWRVGPAERRAGIRPDPYRVWLSEIMLQQTTVAAVTGRFRAFAARWPDIRALATAPREEVLGAWAGLGYYARARNLHACAGVVLHELGGRFPETEAGLRELPGVGPYTAAAIAAIAFDRPAVVVDGNVERVMARIFAEETPLPGAKPRLRELAARLTPDRRPGDYAQAVMDLGATTCTPARPDCAACPWRAGCRGRKLGIAETLPKRTPRPAKPIRHGIAWVVIAANGHVLTERRADGGLLGGMLAVPGTEWAERDGVEHDGPAPADPAPPLPGDWRRIGEVRHSLTHFHLRLDVRLLRLPEPGGAGFLALEDAIAAMPTVHAKAVRLARAASP